MASWRKTAVVALSAALLGGGGVAWAAGGAQPRPAQTVHPAAAPIDASQESRYTPIAPCRIADTRVKGGALGAGVTRAFYVDGTGSVFGDQGGHASGCGIPSAATAIAATVTAVGATGNGFMKVYPAGTAAPAATFLNDTKTFNISNSGSLTLCGSTCAADINVSNYGSAANVVIDVAGYYIKPMFAYIHEDGTLGQNSRVTSVNRVGGAASPYRVFFDRDVSQCSFSITTDYQGMGDAAESVAGDGHGVYVMIWTTPDHNQWGDASFYLTVTC